MLRRIFVLPKDSAEATRLVKFAVEFLLACQSRHVAEHDNTMEDDVESDAEDHVCVHPLLEKLVFPWLLQPEVRPLVPSFPK
jgi:hypothetical protein